MTLVIVANDSVFTHHTFKRCVPHKGVPFIFTLPFDLRRCLMLASDRYGSTRCNHLSPRKRTHVCLNRTSNSISMAETAVAGYLGVMKGYLGGGKRAPVPWVNEQLILLLLPCPEFGRTTSWNKTIVSTARDYPVIPRPPIPRPLPHCDCFFLDTLS